MRFKSKVTWYWEHFLVLFIPPFFYRYLYRLGSPQPRNRRFLRDSVRSLFAERENSFFPLFLWPSKIVPKFGESMWLFFGYDLLSDCSQVMTVVVIVPRAENGFLFRGFFSLFDPEWRVTYKGCRRGRANGLPPPLTPSFHIQYFLKKGSCSLNGFEDGDAVPPPHLLLLLLPLFHSSSSPSSSPSPPCRGRDRAELDI